MALRSLLFLALAGTTVAVDVAHQVTASLQHNHAMVRKRVGAHAATAHPNHPMVRKRKRLTVDANAASASTTLMRRSSSVPEPSAVLADGVQHGVSTGVPDHCFDQWTHWSHDECHGRKCGTGYLQKRNRDFNKGKCPKLPDQVQMSGAQYEETPCKDSSGKPFEPCETEVHSMAAKLYKTWDEHHVANLDALRQIDALIAQEKESQIVAGHYEGHQHKFDLLLDPLISHLKMHKDQAEHFVTHHVTELHKEEANGEDHHHQDHHEDHHEHHQDNDEDDHEHDEDDHEDHHEEHHEEHHEKKKGGGTN